jgi:hypothetical protein
VERRIRIQPVERADLRVCLSRRQLRAIGHSRRHACRRVRRRESESGRSQQDCRRACSTERREKTVKLDGTTQVPIRQIGCGAGAGRARLAQTPHKGAVRIVLITTEQVSAISMHPCLPAFAACIHLTTRRRTFGSICFAAWDAAPNGSHGEIFLRRLLV